MIKTKKSYKNIIAGSAVAIILIIGGLVAGLHYRNSNKSVPSTKPTNTVDYGPPTPTEKKAGDQQKAIDSAKAQSDKTYTPPKQAQLNITDASQYGSSIEIRAFSSNIYENGGTCTAALTLNSKTVTVQSTAFKDATTTQCGSLTIPRSQFNAPGNWQLILTYKSATSTGETPPRNVTIK